MNRALVKKCLAEAQWLLLGCSAAVFAFCWMRVWLVSQLDTSRFKAIIDLLPAQWQKFSPVDMDWIVTYTGRIALAYDEPVVVACAAIWAIARGSDCISGELGRGTMEMLLAQPLSRLQVLATQGSVTVAGAAVIAVAAWCGNWIGIATTSVKEEAAPNSWTAPVLNIEIYNPFAKREVVEVPMGDRVDAAVFWPATFNLFTLGLFFAGLTTLMSSWDRYRWRTIGIVVGFYIVQLMVKTIGLMVDDYQWMLNLTIFTCYEPEGFVQVAAEAPAYAWSVLRYDAEGRFAELGPLGYNLVLIVLGLFSYAGAAVVFARRDLPAPL
jgi:ABC-2 type transport system permease protein